MSTATLILADAAATEAAGARLAAALRGGMVIAISGELGAGKTTLVAGLPARARVERPGQESDAIRWLNIIQLPSLYFYHFDFYRFADPSEWETAGLADCFRDDAVCVVEWPERVAGLLPPPDLALTLVASGRPVAYAGRQLALVAHTEDGERCLTRDDFALGERARA